MEIGKEGAPYVIEPIIEPVPGRKADYQRHTALEDARWAKTIYEAVLGVTSIGASR